MPDTHWCPRCGAEYQPGFTTCADCGVALVDEPPPPDSLPVSAPIGADEPFVYDLTEWPTEWRDSLQWMIAGRNIPYQWESEGMLVVPSGTEETVDGFIEFIASGDPDADDSDADTPEIARSGEMTIDEFYDADPRRRASDEDEFGIDWTDADGVAYEVCWVRDTGELFLVEATDGVNVEVLGFFPERWHVEQVLDDWQTVMLRPNSVEWVRERVRDRPLGFGPDAEAVPDVAPEPAPATAEPLFTVPEADAGWWTPPAAIGWVTSDLDDLAARYSELRADRTPDDALAQAIVDVLDAGSAERLTEFFAGEKDVVYGDGAGAAARVEMRDAIEGRPSG